jgi:hypothetical protein
LLLSLWQRFDLLKAADEPTIRDDAVRLGIFDAEDLICARPKKLGESDQKATVEPQLSEFVVGYQRLLRTELFGDLGLCQAASLADVSEVLADLSLVSRIGTHLSPDRRFPHGAQHDN